MKTCKRSFLIDGNAGAIEAVLEWKSAEESPFPKREEIKAMALVAHPHPLHGGTMENKVVQTLVRAFNDCHFAALRFNFRGVGKSAGEHTGGLGETEDMLTLAQWMRAHFPDLPLYAAGFSFGAFVAVSAQSIKPFARLILIGTAVGRFAVGKVPNDSIVIHGSQDDTVPLSQVLSWAEPQKLIVHVLAGADHFFHQRLIDLRSLIVREIQNKADD